MLLCLGHCPSAPPTLVVFSVSEKNQILEAEHNSMVAGYRGQNMTIELVRQNFFSPDMEQFTDEYVGSRPECDENKAVCHAH
jgi:hypothetical protein